MSSIEMQGQFVLKIANGGRLNASEQGWSINMAILAMLQARDMLMNRDLDKQNKYAIPDHSYYHEYKKVPVTWDETGQVCEIVLKNGNPVDCGYDMGIWLFPVFGEGKFVRASKGWCASNAKLAWCEGYIPWELRPNRIVFPTMEKGSVEFVGMLIIEQASVAWENGTIDENSPLSIPAKHLSLCRNEALGLMGFSTRDLKATFTDEGK